MTYFDIIKFFKESIFRLVSIGFKPEDCRYIDLYSEYIEMRNRGDKITYIVSTLSIKYGVSERTVYNIVKRFSTPLQE